MEKGLTAKEAHERIRSHGLNVITTQEKHSAVSIFLSQFPSIINGILFLASIFSLIIGDIIDAIFILAILLLNGFLGFIQEYRAEKSLEKLKDFVTPLSRVLRDGKEVQIPTAHLVPGDIVVLSEGDRIPADGKLLINHHIEVDESVLTGESLPVMKNQHDLVFGGTLVSKGKGRFLVESTGMNTRFGQIAQTLAAITPDPTPLQIRLSTLGKVLSTIAISISALLIPIGLFQGREFFPLLLTAISISIAAIPEGLPAVVTIALAIGTARMAQKKAIVKKMPAIETLGAVQIILTDKTGTLTQNQMRVKKTWTTDNKISDDFLKACVLGNTASLVQKASSEEFDVIGDKTDGALLLFAKSHKSPEELKDGGKVIDEYVFDPVLKTITTVFEEFGKRYVYVRGAPEAIVAQSTLSEHKQQAMRTIYSSFAQEGLRVIALAQKIDGTHETDRKKLENDLLLLGFVGIYDAPRPETKQAVTQAKQAGIRTIMVTGDNELTAMAIAKEVGLIEQNEDVVTGEELSKMSDQELKEIIGKTRIFARNRPEDKLRLVTVLKELGYIVGVTGDGVNDALALKKADVGLAMGQEGTDVAKEASDIVLVDDNYSTLVSAIEEGRVIYHNILKAITYLLSGNLAEISVVFFGALFGLPAPLLPTQILWMNLVTDGIPALALASDTKDPSLIKHDPRNPKEPILTRSRIILIAGIGFGISTIVLLAFQYMLQTSNETFARTVAFNLLVFLHVILVFAVRGRSIFSVNKFFIVGILTTIIVQILITTLPFFQRIFHLGFS